MSEIRTVEELAALPVGTVLRDGWDSCVEMTPGRPLRRYVLPATVLYRPDLPPQAELRAAVERVRALATESEVINKGVGLVRASALRRALDGAS